MKPLVWFDFKEVVALQLGGGTVFDLVVSLRNGRVIEIPFETEEEAREAFDSIQTAVISAAGARNAKH